MELLIDKLVAFAMVLGGLSIQPNPKADRADALLRYAVADAELVIAYDGQAIVVDNYPRFLKVVDDPALARLPGPRLQLLEWRSIAEQVTVLSKQQWGMDPLDMQRAQYVVFLDLPDRAGDPLRSLIVGRATMPIEAIEATLKPQGARELQIDGRRVFRNPTGELGGLTPDGFMIFGHESWARPRLADGWKPLPRPRGSALAAIGAALDERPFFLAASMPSPGLVERVRGEVDGFPADLYAGHTHAVLWATATGVSWTYAARDPDLAARVELASSGLVEVLRALHVSPRGALELASAALPSYAGRRTELDAIIAAEPQVRAALAKVGGDGTFKASIKRDGARVTAVLRGKKVSDVVPVPALAMLIALGVVRDGDEPDDAAAVSPGSPPPPPRAPASGRTAAPPPPGPRRATPPAPAPRPRAP